MKESPAKSALDAVARRGVPDHTDIWPAIESRLPKEAPFMRLQTKMSWSLLWVLLALALITTAAYALYRYFNDPGLQAARDAGLITDVNTSAESDLLTPVPPFASGTGMARMVESKQTVAGVTLELDWVYVEDARQALHVTASGLDDGMRLGIPELSFVGIQPQQYTGATFSLEADDSMGGTYLVHQLVRRDGDPGGAVDLLIDIPLFTSAEQSGPPVRFHFEVPEVEITVPWGGGGGGEYAVTVNGLEMRMEHAIFASDYTEVRLCYQPPTVGDWKIDKANAVFGDAAAPSGSSVAMTSQIKSRGDGLNICQDLTFPLATPGRDVSFFVTADGLALGGTSTRIDNAWQFSTYVPGNLHIGGIDRPAPVASAPLASETVGDLTATLEWAYLDSNRMAFTVHFAGWQEGYSVGNVALREADGQEINADTEFHPSESDPATFAIGLTPAMPFIAERFRGQLVVTLFTAPDAISPATEFAFNIDLPVYPAMTVESGEVQTAGGLDMILQTVKMTPSYTVVYLCYPKPDPGDWMISGQSTLQIGDDSSSLGTYAMLYDSDYGDLGKGLEPGWRPALAQGRCVKGGFPVGHHEQAESLVLQIDELQKSMPEVIPDADVKAALQRLRAEGIQMDWMTFSGTGGGGGGPVYKKLPQGMTEPEAFRRFIEALGYTHQGPWIFKLDIRP